MKIRTQLALASGATAVFSCLISCLAASLALSGLLSGLLAEFHGVLTRALVQTAIVSLGAGRPEPVQELLQAAGAVPGVAVAFVAGPDGKVMLASKPEPLGVLVGALRERLPPDMVDEAHGFEVGGREHSVHLVTMSPAELQRSIFSQRPLVPPLLAFGAAGTLLSLLFGLGLSMLLSRPIRRLAAAVEEVGKGDLSVQVPVSASGELGELARGFNSMVARLRGLDELKDEFIASVSHDLRNPMAAIRMHIDFMLRSDKERDKIIPRHRESLLVVEDNVSRLGLYVENVLDAAKLKAGKLEPALAPVDLGKIAARAAALFESLARQKGIELRVESSWDHPCEADSELLEHAVSNLVSNAIKFTPDAGRITLRIAARDGRLVLSVEDTGSGIAPEDVPKLFRRFSTVEWAERRAKGIQGTGLGLYIAKQSVEAMGGRISVESTPGRGSLFSISLPLA